MYETRRKKLLKKIKEKHPGISKGVVLLFADYERDRYTFRQESNFYYLTGIKEPSVVFCIYLDGKEELFIPNYGHKRSQWVESEFSVDKDVEIKNLGKEISGYKMPSIFNKDFCEDFLKEIKSYIGKDGKIYSLNSLFYSNYLLEKISNSIGVQDGVIDISSIVSSMRRKKDEYEIDLIKRAINITCLAHASISEKIRPGILEKEIRADIEHSFILNGSDGPSFPSIVASGKNTTILHYTSGNCKFCEGDLVVVDIGADFESYASDLTRTYAVSRKFTKKQKFFYDLVLDVQKYVIDLAKPGMFLFNKNCPEKSLHHLAVEFLNKREYSQYFVHGIGHFMGLDVHDVGDFEVELEEGNVFTVEPGIYIPDEKIGIRIEDDVVITKKGCEVLSKKLKK